MKSRLIKKCIAYLLAFIMTLGIAPTPVLADMRQTIRNTPEQNQTILDMLQNFDGSLEQADELLRSFGLLDADGNLNINQRIYLNGIYYTLDEITEIINRRGTDLSQIAWVDGTPVALGDLKTMIEIEEEIARIRDILLSDIPFTAEHAPYLEELLRQMATTGINFNAAAPPVTQNIPAVSLNRESLRLNFVNTGSYVSGGGYRHEASTRRDEAPLLLSRGSGIDPTETISFQVRMIGGPRQTYWWQSPSSVFAEIEHRNMDICYFGNPFAGTSNENRSHIEFTAASGTGAPRADGVEMIWPGSVETLRMDYVLSILWEDARLWRGARAYYIELFDADGFVFPNGLDRITIPVYIDFTETQFSTTYNSNTVRSTSFYGEDRYFPEWPLPPMTSPNMENARRITHGDNAHAVIELATVIELLYDGGFIRHEGIGSIFGWNWTGRTNYEIANAGSREFVVPAFEGLSFPGVSATEVYFPPDSWFLYDGMFPSHSFYHSTTTQARPLPEITVHARGVDKMPTALSLGEIRPINVHHTPFAGRYSDTNNPPVIARTSSHTMRMLNDGTRPYVRNVTIPTGEFYPGQIVPIMVEFSRAVNGIDARLEINGGTGGIVINDEQFFGPTLNAVRHPLGVGNQYSRVHMFEYVVGPTDGSTFRVTEIFGARDMFGNEMLAEDGVSQGAWRNNVDTHIEANIRLRSFLMADAVQGISLDRHIVTNICVLTGEADIAVALDVNQHPTYRTFIGLLGQDVHGNFPAPFHLRVTNVADPNSVTLFPLYLYAEDGGNHLYVYGTISGMPLAVNQTDDVYIVEIIAIDPRLPEEERRESVVFGTYTSFLVEYRYFPAIIIPESVRTIIADRNQPAQVRWFTRPGAFAPEAGGDFTIEIFRGFHDIDPLDAAFGTMQPIYTSFADLDSLHYTVPENIFDTLSFNDVPTYTARVSAMYQGNEAAAIAHVVVVPVRARVNIPRPANTSMLDTQAYTVNWTIAPFMEGSTQAELTIHRVSTINGQDVTELVHTADISNSGYGSFALDFARVNGLRNLYMINIQARNVDRETDPGNPFYSPWNTDSLVLRVYNADALSLSYRDRTPMPNTITLSNIPTVQGLTLQDVSGQTQMTTPEILRLRENLALMEFVGINFDDHAWNMLHDRIDWDTSDDSVVSVNFRQGAIYENLSRFGDMLFLPETVMGLSGLQDGYAVVTATHAATGMSDSVTVNVETMRDQLFIIQASPAIRTSLRYMPVGSNVYRQVWTNDTGTIVLYEPEGIAGNIYMRGENDEGVWLGTLHLDNVLTGERDWTLLQLYPLNTVFMRLTARTDIFLRRPDGTPLTGNVTVRGGVYINGGYAQDALLGTSPNSVDMGSGKSPRTFTIGPGGRLSIYMDSTQFWSEELGHNSNRQLIPADRLLYIFEISEIAGDTLRPVLVYVNGSMSPRQIVRGGESIVGLEHAVGGKGPFVAAQRVEYPGFRRPSADVLHFTGEIGPDETYRHIELVTTALIWGTEFEGDMGGHRIDITDEFGFMPTAQTSYNDSYPFSSIPLVRSRLELSEDSMTASGWVTPATRVGLRSRLSYEQTVISDIPTGFRVLDMNTFPHIQENPDVLNAIDDLIESIQTPGPSGSSGMQTSRNSFMRRALSIMGDFDSGQGDPPFRIAITPTENNPAVFNALIWVGHEGVEMKDIEFDDSGFSWNYNFLESDVPNVASDIKEFFVGDRKNRANTFSDISDALSGAKKSKGPDISVTFTGFYTAEIRFNFDTGAWEIFTTGGGFTAGIGLEFKWSMSKLVGPVPVAVSLTLGGALMFEFETAVRHSEIPGYEWHPDVVASRVNDYLTTLRINAYVKAFAGIGFDKSVVALKVGIFGELTIDSVNRWLSRTYLADESQRQINGQGLRVTGEAGIRFVARLLFLSFTHTFVSVGFTYDRVFNQWNYINDYWNNTGTGLPRGINPAAGAMPMSQGLELIESTATLVSRDYLHQFARSWGSPAGRFMPLVLDNPNRLEQLQSNAYPESRPVITDDGQLLLYLFDQNSDDIRDTRVFATAMNASGAYPEGREIAAPAGFTGYGDMLLRLAGNQNFAAAAWVRMSTYLPYTNAGDAVSIEQQSLLMNATEVVASIYSNGSWASTRITDSQTPNLAPVVATNGTNRAIVAWRSVFASDNENILDFDVQDQILYRIFENGTWGDTIVLYNGTSGSVMGIEAAMLPDGTAMVAYTLDRSHGSGDAAYFEMAYSIVAADGQPEASWIITSDDSINENPQVAAVNFGTTATPDYRFILGWHSVYEGLGDIRLVAINSQGIVSNSFIDAISHVAANVSIAGNFRFASNGTLGGLSIVWAETYDLIGESDALLATNDVLRAVKFTENGISAPLEVAQMPPRTQIDHFNVYAVSPTEVRAVIQATEYKEIDLDDPTTFIATYFDDFDYYTNEYVRHYVFVPNYETKLFTATAHYRNSAELLSVLSEHSNVAPNSYVSVRFDLFNAGYGVINRADIQLGSQTFTFNNLEIMPNESLGLIAHYLVGNTVENLPYTVTAYFGNTAATTLMGTKMLDFPDVGISSIEVIREDQGIRTVRLTLFNDSRISLARPGRSVTAEFFDNTQLVDRFDNLTATISDMESLRLIDEGAFTIDVDFDLADFVLNHPDLNVTEIPASGIPFVAHTRILQDGYQQNEADMSNNTRLIFLDGLLARTGENISLFTSQGLYGGNTTAEITVRNNALSNRVNGNITAMLLDHEGYVLETVHSHQVGLISLGGEESRAIQINFTQPGSRVIATFTEVDLNPANSGLYFLGFENLPVGLEDFDFNTELDQYRRAPITNSAAVWTRVIAGAHNPNATIEVFVNDILMDEAGGMVDLHRLHEIRVEVTSPDGTTSTNYVLPFTFVAVTGITDMPTEAVVGVPLALTATVQPSNATRQDIVWNIEHQNNTGAEITDGNILTAASYGLGYVIVSATIIGGLGDTDWTYAYFRINLTDATPPTVIGVSPSGTGVAITSNQLVITFDKPMDTAFGTVTVTGGAAIVSNPVWTNNTTVTYTLSGLAQGIMYTVNISGFRDIAGNVMAADNTNTFTTAAAGQIPTPPTGGATGPARHAIRTSAVPVTGGTIIGSGTYNAGSPVALTARANPNYIFAGWYEGGNRVSTDLTLTFTASADRTLQARFTRITPTTDATINANINGTNVSVPLAEDGITLVFDTAIITNNRDNSGEFTINITNHNPAGFNLSISALGTDNLRITTGFGAILIPNATMQAINRLTGDTLWLLLSGDGFGIALLDENGAEIVYDDLAHQMFISIPVTIAPGTTTNGYVAAKQTATGSVIMPYSIYHDGHIVFQTFATGTFSVIYNGTNFADVNGTNWALPFITFTAARGIFDGIGNNQFAPENLMTRAMFAQVLANINGTDLSAFTTSRFHDVDANTWYAPAVEWAASVGIVMGIGDNNFAPDRNITRQEMAAMLHNYIQFRDYDIPSGYAAAFNDDANIAPWAREAVNTMQDAGILIGRPGGNFEPNETATRAEAATIFTRFIEAYMSNFAP